MDALYYPEGAIKPNTDCGRSHRGSMKPCNLTTIRGPAEPPPTIDRHPGDHAAHRTRLMPWSTPVLTLQSGGTSRSYSWAPVQALRHLRALHSKCSKIIKKRLRKRLRLFPYHSRLTLRALGGRQSYSCATPYRVSPKISTPTVNCTSSYPHIPPTNSPSTISSDLQLRLD